MNTSNTSARTSHFWRVNIARFLAAMILMFFAYSIFTGITARSRIEQADQEATGSNHVLDTAMDTTKLHYILRMLNQGRTFEARQALVSQMQANIIHLNDLTPASDGDSKTIIAQTFDFLKITAAKDPASCDFGILNPTDATQQRIAQILNQPILAAR